MNSVLQQLQCTTRWQHEHTTLVKQRPQNDSFQCDLENRENKTVKSDAVKRGPLCKNKCL